MGEVSERAKPRELLVKTTLVVFTYNEIEAVRELIDRFPFDTVDEHFFVDGKSTDGTLEFLENRGIPVFIQEEPGHGEAFKIGMREASGDVLVFIGCDGNDRPEDIPLLVEEIKKGYDIVIASRFGKKSHSFDATPIRHFGNWFFAHIVNKRWGAAYTDVFNEFRAIKKSEMERMNLRSSFFELELEMAIKAAKRGLKTSEVPTVEEERLGGEAKLMTLRDGWMNLKTLILELTQP